MNSKNIIVLTSIILVFFTLNAQQSEIYTNDFIEYQTALSLYNNKQYQSSQNLFNSIKRKTSDIELQSGCSYYIANCAVRLNKPNAEDLIQRFVSDYPTSPKTNSAYLEAADYYFQNSKYAYARKWYDKVEVSSLARIDRERFYFNNGYTYFITKNYKEAKKYFNYVVNSATYGSQAKYYIGFMAYEGDDYEKANTYFEKVSDDDKFKKDLTYYQADLNFKLGKFEKSISLAKEQLPESNPNEKSELSKIIGESYFNLKQYDNAIPYLFDYKGKKGKWNNTDYYQLGYAYYKQKSYTKAISEFNKIIDGKNNVSQNAYYHLGECYSLTDKKQEALNAFRNASQMDYDLNIQEDAWLNYAKISYDIGNPYQSVPQVLNDYLEKYPRSTYKEEIESLLIDSYISSKNYKEALKLLENSRNIHAKTALQKVAFYRGIELYNDTKYAEAKSLFKKSLSQPRDNKLTARATFWKAETDYNLANYQQALIGYKEFEKHSDSKEAKEIKHINYHIAYTYLKLKNYPQSISFFYNYCTKNEGNTHRIADAFLRLGDSYFASSNYKNAIESYSNAIKVNVLDADYPSFQKAMSYGYLGQGDKKIELLNSFITSYPNSIFRDDALYELANSFMKVNKTDKAMSLYNKLISEYPNSLFIPKALLRQGLSYYNSNNNNKALVKFKKVAENYPSTQEAMQAVATSRLIYIDLGRVDEYASWVKTLEYVEITDAELDNTTYLAAEKQFLDGNTKKALQQFNRYLTQIPNGMHRLKAHFFLAELYAKEQLPENATPHYEFVITKSKGEYTEQALVKLSEIHLNTPNNQKAIPILKRLETEADQPQNITYAQSNLMKAYYKSDDYNKAESYAQKVLDNVNTEAAIKNDALIIIARSAFKVGDLSKAKQTYKELEKTGTGGIQAEALYYNAYFKHNDQDFESSNNIIQKLAKDYSSYKYYGAKGLIVMAKNYYALQDAFQATYILESVIENFDEFTDLTNEAQLELQHIKKEQAKTNASITND